MPRNSITPLKANPQKAAYSSIGGYKYQIFFSLLQWIKLKDDEAIFLENGEDIDKLKANESIVTQVKQQSKKVSLRDKGVIEAINNYWYLVNKNDTLIKLHFYTTAERAIERGARFDKKSGLDYWDECKKGGSVEPIKDFLFSLKDIDPSLKLFIKESSDVEFLEKIVKPISWITGSMQTGDLQKEIDDLLVIRCQSNNHRVTEADKARRALLEHVFTVVSNKKVADRRLDSVDFMRVFEEAVTVRVPSYVKEAYINNLDAIVDSVKFARGISEAEKKEFIDSYLLSIERVIKDGYVTRELLIHEAIEKLKRDGVLVIVGSSGMGKTTFAVQIARKNEGFWRRVSFRNLNDQQALKYLKYIHAFYGTINANLILDDINFSDFTKDHKYTLEHFFELLKNSGKCVIIGTYKAPSSGFLRSLNVSAESVFNIPTLSEAEISYLLEVNGCPKNEIDFWKKDVLFTTKNHPQLVDARIKRHKIESWKKERVLFETEELNQVKKESSEFLLDQLPSSDCVSLLTALTVYTGNFKKKNAIKLGKEVEGVADPDTTFDKLIGPYLEQIGEDDYTISPLLTSTYKNKLNQEQVRHLHEIAARSFLPDKLLDDKKIVLEFSPQDISRVLWHALVSESHKMLLEGIMIFELIPDDKRNVVYSYIDWITYLRLDKPLFQNDEIINGLLRKIQFSVCLVASDAKHTLAVADTWFKEIGQLKGITILPQQFRDSGFVSVSFYSIVLLSGLEGVPLLTAIKWLNSLLKLIEEKTPIIESLEQMLPDKDVLVGEFFTFIFFLKKVNSLNLEELFLVGKTQVDAIFGYIDASDLLSRSLVDSIWLEESKHENPDWDAKIRFLYTILKLAEAKGLKNISALLLKSVAIIKNEYLNDTKGAIEIIAYGLTKYQKNFDILNYSAKVHFINKDYKNALDIWSDILPKATRRSNSIMPFSARDAAVAAARIGNQVAAYAFFQKASKFAKKHHDPVFTAQCLADAGLCLWVLGQYARSLRVFTRAIKLLLNLPDPKDNLRVWGLTGMLSKTLTKLSYETNLYPNTLKKDSFELYPGMFSELDYIINGKDIYVNLRKVQLLHIAQIENNLGIQNNDDVYEEIRTFEQELLPVFQIKFQQILIQRSIIKKNSLLDISNLFKFYDRSLAAKKAAISADPTLQDVAVAIEDFTSGSIKMVVYSFLSFALEKGFEDVPISEMKIGAEMAGISNHPEWISMIDHVSSLNLADAIKGMRDVSSPNSIRVSSCIYVLTHDESRENVLHASCLLIIDVSNNVLFGYEFARHLLRHVEIRWKAISFKLQKFNEKECNELRMVCSSNEDNVLKKIAKIVLAASKLCIQNIDNVKADIVNIAQVG